VAVAAALAGWLVRLALTPVVGPTAIPFIAFFPAVAMSAWYGGFRPAIFTVVLAIVASDWSFLPPLQALNLSDGAAIAAFGVASVCIIAPIEALRRARSRRDQQIKAKTKSELDLAASRDLLETTLSSIGDAVIVTDASGKITFVNREAERLTGWQAADARGTQLSKVFPILNELTRQEVENPVEKVVRLGKVIGLANHTLLVSKDGREVPIDDSAAPIRNPDGSIGGVVLVFRDVGQQRLAQAAQARLAAIVEFSGDAIIAKDLNGRILSWNGSAQRIFGYTADEAIGKPITMLIPPDRIAEEDQILGNIRRGRPFQRLETIRLTKDGREVPVSVSVSPLKDSEGKVIGASKIVHDISDIVAARQELARERQLLETTLVSIGDAVIATDAQGIVTFLNAEAERLTEWRASEAAGRPLAEVFHIINEHTRARVENPVEKVLRVGDVVGLANHTILVSRHGRETPIDDSAAPIRAPGMDTQGVVLVFRDITERKRTEKALQQADRRKDEFLAILSHELRNPLAPISMAVDMLRKLGPQNAELVALRDIIARQTKQLSRLLDDLLDVSRIGLEKISIHTTRIAVQVAINTAIESVRPLVEIQNHQLTVDLPDAPVEIEGDLGRLSQVFANLLNNAAKYTPRGGHISVALAREDGRAVVRVRDTGIGIAPDKRTQIFELFAQLDQSHERGQGGLGVGLSLARTIVELHGGEITVHSDGPGKGSEFIVSLPLVESAAATSTLNDAAAGAGLRADRLKIVVADDNADSVTVLASMLDAFGHEVKTAQDGVAARDLIESFAPDVALLDIGMPKLSGYEVAERTRSREAATGHHTTLVAVTGWGQEHDRQRAHDAGFDHHLTKPLDFELLQQMLATIPGGAR
jgi:PAS domain S-box-containing protein